MPAQRFCSSAIPGIADFARTALRRAEPRSVLVASQLRAMQGEARVKHKYVVIGAGFAGLAAARTLVDEGRGRVECVVLEGGTRVGGRAHTHMVRPSYRKLPEIISLSLVSRLLVTRHCRLGLTARNRSLDRATALCTPCLTGTRLNGLQPCSSQVWPVRRAAGRVRPGGAGRDVAARRGGPPGVRGRAAPRLHGRHRAGARECAPCPPAACEQAGRVRSMAMLLPGQAARALCSTCGSAGCLPRCASDSLLGTQRAASARLPVTLGQ